MSTQEDDGTNPDPYAHEPLPDITAADEKHLANHGKDTSKPGQKTSALSRPAADKREANAFRDEPTVELLVLWRLRSAHQVSNPLDWAAQHRAQRLNETAELRARHERLLNLHPDGIVAHLLREHAPVAIEAEHRSGTYFRCHTCPENHQAGGTAPADWPCPTWSTINSHTT